MEYQYNNSQGHDVAYFRELLRNTLDCAGINENHVYVVVAPGKPVRMCNSWGATFPLVHRVQYVKYKKFHRDEVDNIISYSINTKCPN